MQENINNLVLYLSEEKSNMISIKKLERALNARDKDAALMQHGTENLMKYQESLKK